LVGSFIPQLEQTRPPRPILPPDFLTNITTAQTAKRGHKQNAQRIVHHQIHIAPVIFWTGNGNAIAESGVGIKADSFSTRLYRDCRSIAVGFLAGW